jgi:N-acetyltransferase
VLRPFGLEGQRVRLEPLDDSHAPELAAAGARDRESYAFTWVPDGLADARRYVTAALAGRDSGRAVPFAVRHLESGQVVGSTRFLDLDVFTWPPPWPPGVGSGPEPSEENPPTVAEIGSTWYAASARRTAVNTECKLLMLRHAFETWRVARVTLKTDARNKASRAAIDRLGGRFEGVRRAHSLAQDGTIRDTAYFSIVAAEWPEVRDGLERRLTPPVLAALHRSYADDRCPARVTGNLYHRFLTFPDDRPKEPGARVHSGCERPQP